MATSPCRAYQSCGFSQASHDKEGEKLVMRASLRALYLMSALSTPALIISCEDGPEQLFKPNDGDPNQQNGFKPGSYTNPDPKRPFIISGGQDNVARARFCSEAEAAAQVQDMVVKPIIPDESVGGVKM